MCVNKFKLNLKKVQEITEKNKLAFNKSFYGKLNNINMHTPDRQITPNDDKPMRPCNDCNGCGEIIEWDEDDNPEPVSCPSCKGFGEIEKDEEDEW